jgi:hypothetical protein
LRYATLNLIDYNSFELEDTLPGLFYLIRQGRQRGRGNFSSLTPAQMAFRLAADDRDFEGLDDPDNLAILEAWLKGSILRMASRGRNERVMSVRPLHFLSYRIDLPVSWAHLRSVPDFVAVMLHREDARKGDRLEADRHFGLRDRQNLFVRTFGSGLGKDPTFPTEATQDRYHDAVELDIESLLLVRLMESVDPPNPITGRQGEVKPFEPLCPWQANCFREDFSKFLRAYSPETVPASVLGEFVLALLSLNLTVYFLSHAMAANDLYGTGRFSDDRGVNSGRRWEPAIFVDLTNGRNSKCRELARASLQRHSRILSSHLRTIVGFRLLEKTLGSARYIPEIKALSDGATLIERLEVFARCRQPVSGAGYHTIQAQGSALISRLEEDEANHDFLSGPAISIDQFDPFDRLIEALVLSGPELEEQMQKFLRASARQGHHTSMLARPTARRIDSYYTLTSGMIEMLIQLVQLKSGVDNADRAVDVYDFVNELRHRYGIWIDRCPEELDSSLEAHQAARANMEALKETLRQLGALRAVTDARGMQWILPRYKAQDRGEL